ncbi:MAG: glycosyltransferase family 39 protein, partial [Nocardiopsaceae bacterium]|nr:glycosyltransferase family 39 protein [Nocardiopsaceae bacterium]
QAQAVGTKTPTAAEPDTPAVVPPSEPGTPSDKPGREARQSGGYQPGPLWARWLPPVVAFLISLWGINHPSFWRDEAATIAAVKRPLGDLIKMLGNVDAVHGAYYLLMWPVEHVFGAGELVLRLPSAVAVAIGAAFVAALGRRLISPWAGLAAGLLYAVLPVTSRYGQEARSYAMVMTVAAIASYLLVRVLASEPERQRRWLVGYGVSIAVLGILNIFGLLLVPAHALTMWLYCRRGLREQATRRLAIEWLIATAAGIVVASPLLVLGYLQRGQIAWLGVNRSTSGVGTLFSLSGSYIVTTTLLIIVAVALVLSTEMSRAKRRADWPWRLAQVSLPWLILPPLLLLAASTVQPVYTSRYILLCVPAIALIGGAAIVTYGRVVGTVALGIMLIAGVPSQLGQRTESGHYDDILAIDKIIAAKARPGDVVLYTNPNAESFGAAYSFGLGKLRNIALKQGPIPSGTLAGTHVSVAKLRSRLTHVKRVWIVEINSLATDPLLLGLNGLPRSLTPVMDGLPLSYRNYWSERGDYLVLYSRG